MNTFLRLFSAPATRYPGTVLLILLVLTVGLGSFLRSLHMEIDLTEFRSENSEAGQAMERIESEFIDPSVAIQIIIDSGPNGNILTPDGFETIEAIDTLIVDSIDDALLTGSDGDPIIRSIPAALSTNSSPREDPIPTNATIGTMIEANPALARMTSIDRDLQQGSARAVYTAALLDPSLSASERMDATNRLEQTLSDSSLLTAAGISDVEISVVSQNLFEESLMEATRAEAPLLFGLALLVIIVILGVTYRNVRDTAIGFVGLILTVVWTFGFAALLGPEWLGITGPLSQLAILVPVLMIGLGIDYAVHLTTRYREQRDSGDLPRQAARKALHTVGAALVLASAATVVGFGANVTAPLQITADFALFIAVGIISASIIMGYFVPAARVLLDQRQLGTSVPTEQKTSRDGWITKAPASMAVRIPLVGALVATLLGAGSLAAASDLTIRFDRADFIPSGSSVEALQEHQRDLFGGQLDDVTYVVIEGDLTDPRVLNTILAAEESLSDIAGVATINGEAQVRSITSLFRNQLDMSQHDVAAVPPIIGALGWNGSQFDSNADLQPLYALARERMEETELSQMVNADLTTALIQIQTTGGDSQASSIRAALLDAFHEVEQAGADVQVTSQAMIMGEMSDDLAGFQFRSLAITLIVVLGILVGYYRVAHQRITFGIVAMVPAIISASLLLGTMWLLDISVNAVTATMTAIAVGIGVPYGVHVVNRFAEELRAGFEPDEAVGRTLQQTGRAIAGSGLTTLGAFIVLSFANLGPVQQLGILGAFGIVYAGLAAMLVMPGLLVFWERRDRASIEPVQTS